ncbi:phage BR0599 family protein [Candidatus Bandiella numerosa]|uniref:phage BR0599 family protein n=1 Tax=Candidatus Bandiella numerosa TaxID=2570586 RepID=UPI001F352DF8|nr:phage BR0599 family protein [Candidatus Bandiella numerosa]
MRLSTRFEKNYKFYGKISKVFSNNILFDAERKEENFYFNFGKITFLSGNNTGLCFQVKNFKNGEIELILPSIYKLEIGDTYSVIAGCDKNFSSCVTKFNNALNFRGEPYISKVLTRL